MNDGVEAHYYSGSGGLADAIADRLQTAGKSLGELTTVDLGSVDEFHIRGRKATLEIGAALGITDNSHVLDIGSGLGGPARTIAEVYGCHVTGVDLTAAFCEAAEVMSGWVGLGDKVEFVHGDATDLPFENDCFDAAMTIHVAMNIPAKDKVYAHVHRVVKPGGVFVVYDVLQGEGGEVLFPAPWAREPSISHLATVADMRSLLTRAGFEIVEEYDSTEESQSWFEAMAARMAESRPPPVTFQVFLGEDYPEMTRNQVRNLSEKRIRTVTFICRA